MISEHRNSKRLNIDHGIVFLRYLGEPGAACALSNLSEQGCLGELRFSTLDAQTAEFWRALLAVGLEVDADICRLPWIFHFHIKAKVVRVEPHENAVFVGLHFTPNEAQCEHLRQALLSLAVERFHHTTQLHAHAHSPADTTSSVVDNQSVPTSKSGAALPAQHAPRDWSPRTLLDILISRGVLKKENVPASQAVTTCGDFELGRQLLREHAITPLELCHALSVQSNLPIANLEQIVVPEHLKKLFSYLTLLRYEFVPYAESKEMLCIAAVQPLPQQVINQLERASKKRIIVFLAPIDQIHHLQFILRPRGTHQERQHLRVRTTVPATYQYCDKHGVNLDEEIHHGHTADMSENGFLIIGPVNDRRSPIELVEKGICMRIELECDPEPVHALCKICHVAVVKDDVTKSASWAIGVQVSSIESNEFKALRDKCVRASLDQMRNRSRGLTPS